MLLKRAENILFTYCRTWDPSLTYISMYKWILAYLIYHMSIHVLASESFVLLIIMQRNMFGGNSNIT